MTCHASTWHRIDVLTLHVHSDCVWTGPYNGDVSHLLNYRVLDHNHSVGGVGQIVATQDGDRIYLRLETWILSVTD